MANISPTNPISIETELGNLSQYKYFPGKIVSVTLNRLTDMLDGKVDIVDPSNPFTYLLETSCLNTAFAIQEYTLECRKLYPRLANTDSDLYHHMSDFDFLGIFSEPSYTTINFNILLNDFVSKAYYDPVLKMRILKIPRNYSVSVDKYIFTLSSAIIISQSDNGVIDVKYENQTYNNIFPITTNHIDFTVVKVNQQETYIRFQVNAPEVDIEATEVAVEKSTLFKGVLNFNSDRLFYYFRAFYYANNTWQEMIVTHTEEVYDINKPTCIIKVLKNEKQVQYYIPPVYVNNILTNSKVKFLIYTTNGYVDVNFNNFSITDFKATYSDVFPDIELDNTTAAVELITKVIYIQDTVVGGKGELSFSDTKQAVIDNSIGDRKLPITQKQLDFYTSQNNFKIIPDVDVVTNRVFLLSTDLPNATTRYPITKINMDILEYSSTISNIIGKNGVYQYNNNLTAIYKGTVFRADVNELYMLTPQERQVIESLSGLPLIQEINNNRYVSTFYHYVLDTSTETFAVRAYDLDARSVSNINFRVFNDKSQVGINTTSIDITKVSTGYRLTVNSNVKLYKNNIDINNITPYLIYQTPAGGMFYLKGTLYTTSNNNPIYNFDIGSQFIVDRDNNMLLTTFKDSNNQPSYIWAPLSSDFKLIYLSDVIPDNYQPSDIEQYIKNSFLNNANATVTLEDITIVLGLSLDRLYTREHSSVTNNGYQLYTADVPATYLHTVYDSTNAIVHNIGDTVLDSSGNTVYAHRAGDPVLDANNNPVPISALEITRYINLLLIDYKPTVCTNSDILNYIEYLRSYLTEVVVSNAVTVQDNLLENTESYVVIPKTIDQVNVVSNSYVQKIPSTQTFNLSVYVTSDIYLNNTTRDTISYTIISAIDSYLYNNTTLIKTELLDTLYTQLKDYVRSISVDKFTQLDSEYITVTDTNSRISLNKVLTSDVTGYSITDDVNITFIQV
jgi:hypothetical protein